MEKRVHFNLDKFQLIEGTK